MNKPPLPPRMNRPPPPHDLPRAVPVNANNSNNNLGSVASSVSFGHQSEGNVNNGNWENWNENENYNENNNGYSRTNSAATPEGWVNDGSTAFSVGVQSNAFIGPGARERFNKISDEVIAAHPEWRLESVAGNPLAYGDEQPGYVLMVSTIADTDADALFAVWPLYAAAMEERIPGLGLPTDLKVAIGWRNYAAEGAAAFAAQMAQGGRRKRHRKAKARKTRKARKNRRKTRRGRRN
jgi:hypothetical protein